MRAILHPVMLPLHFTAVTAARRDGVRIPTELVPDPRDANDKPLIAKDVLNEQRA